MTYTLTTYPDIVTYAVPVFIDFILIELAWVAISGRGGCY